MKDYYFSLNNHLGKAYVVYDALSRKSLHASGMMMKEVELVESFRDLNLGFTLTPSNKRLNHVVLASNVKG